MFNNFRYINDVQEFHNKFGLVTPEKFTFLPDDLFKFRVGFFNEELTEYLEAYRDNDLATAIDSLIDLIYIINGCALLHGISVSEFAHSVTNTFVHQLIEDEPYPNQVDYLPLNKHNFFEKSCKYIIESYMDAHGLKNEEVVRTSLAIFYVYVLAAAKQMGLTESIWNEFWDDVQRANMSKVRAEKATDSKRGSAWDVIKPVGWQGPKTEEILAKYYVKA